MKAYTNLFKGVVKFIKNEELIGSIEKVKINNDVEIVVNGRFNKTINATNVLAKLVLWRTDRFGEILVTDRDIRDMLKNVIEEKINNLFNPCNKKDFEIIDAAIKVAANWIYNSTYKDMIGSVGPIEIYKENKDRITVYLDGTIAINNLEIKEKADLDTLTSYFSKQVKKLLNNKKKLK